jgi:hypothetical protein
MLSIIALTLNSGGYNPLLHRIVVVDSLLSLGLLLALAIYLGLSTRARASRDGFTACQGLPDRRRPQVAGRDA